MNAMYSIEQVNVPPELGTIMKQYTKAVIKDKPQDLYKYSANFFAILGGHPQIFDENGELTEAGQALPSNTAWGGPQNVTSAPENEATDSHNEEYMEEEAINALFLRYATAGDSSMPLDDLPSLLADIREVLGLAESDLPTADEVIDMLRCDDDVLNLAELRQLLFESEPQQ